jgi:hypothetical protein
MRNRAEIPTKAGIAASGITPEPEGHLQDLLFEVFDRVPDRAPRTRILADSC